MPSGEAAHTFNDLQMNGGGLEMTSHPWLPASAATAARVRRARASCVLRQLPTVTVKWLGHYAAAWPPLVAVLPALLRTDSGRVLDAVGRVDVLPALIALADGPVDAGRLERALVTLWLALAGHPGLTAPLALPGPFRECVVDPTVPRLLDLGDARGLAATAAGPVVIARAGRAPIDRFVSAVLPAANDAVIVDERFRVPDPQVVARVQAALGAVVSVLPGGRLERVTIGGGEAVDGEARVGSDAAPAALLASAQAAFVRAAATVDPVATDGGCMVEHGRRFSPADVVARASGNALALPWRPDRDTAMAGVIDDLEDFAVIAAATATGADLIAAIRALAESGSTAPRRALLVNLDADDFVYSYQFGRSVERRCVERGLRLDRVAVNPGWRRDLGGELGGQVPAPIADGTETLVEAEDDASLAAALRRVSVRGYEVVAVNVRPRLFFDLAAAGLLAGRTLVWDRHLHDGFREENARRGPVRRTPETSMQVWSTFGESGDEFKQMFVDAGAERVWDHVWPMDLEFFRSSATPQPGRVFAGGDSGRDWPLFIAAIRDLPFDVQLVTGRALADLPPQVRVDPRLPLWRFRDAMAEASITAIPLLPDGHAAGITVLAMAMAVGSAVVVTDTWWIAQYVTDGEEALLVPPGDVAGFRAALVRVHEDAALRARLIANARRRVAGLCDLEAFTRRMFAGVP